MVLFGVKWWRWRGMKRYYNSIFQFLWGKIDRDPTIFTWLTSLELLFMSFVPCFLCIRKGEYTQPKKSITNWLLIPFSQKSHFPLTRRTLLLDNILTFVAIECSQCSARRTMRFFRWHLSMSIHTAIAAHAWGMTNMKENGYIFWLLPGRVFIWRWVK